MTKTTEKRWGWYNTATKELHIVTASTKKVVVEACNKDEVPVRLTITYEAP